MSIELASSIISGEPSESLWFEGMNMWKEKNCFIDIATNRFNKDTTTEDDLRLA